MLLALADDSFWQPVPIWARLTALNIATRVAMQQKVPVAIFSLEMTKEQLTNRILSSEAGIDSQAFRTGALRARTGSIWHWLLKNC